jgi:photosystem II stability/assembly factor-like uncharacterized protein
MRCGSVLLLALLGGCAADDVCAPFSKQSCIALTVKGASQLDQLRLDSAELGLADAPSPATPLARPVAPPIQLAVLPDPAFAGDFALRVRGLLAAITVGEDRVPGRIAAGQHLRLVAVLGAPDGGAGDLAGIDDFGGAEDLGGADDLAAADLGGLEGGDGGGVVVVWQAANAGLFGAQLLDIAVAPANVVYVATDGAGVFRSGDNGATWSAANGNLPFRSVAAIAVAPSNSQVVYVSGGDSPSVPDTVYRSTDGGQTWAFLSLGATVAKRLVVDPTDPDTCWALPDSGLGLLRTANGGSTWSDRSSGITDPVLGLVIDPSTPSTLYAGTGKIYKTTNSGVSWAEAQSGLTFPAFVLAIAPTNPQILFAGGNGPLFKTVNGAGSWTTIQSVNMVRTDVKVDPTDAQIVYDAAFDKGILRSTNGGTNFVAASSGLGGLGVRQIEVSSTNMYTFGVNADPFRAPRDTLAFTLTNNGITNATINWVAVAPSSPATVYAGGVGLFKSTDRGGTWTRTNDAAMGSATVFRIAVHPTNPQIVLAGTSGGVFRTVDGGANWTLLNLGATVDSVTALSFAPSVSTTVYAAVNLSSIGPSVVKSTSGGDSFSPVNGGLGGIRVQSIAIHPTDANVVYLGGETGVFRTGDGAATLWAKSSTGLPSGHMVNNVLIAPDRPQILYAAGSLGIFESVDGGNTWGSQVLNNQPVGTLALAASRSDTLYGTINLNHVVRSLDGGATFVDITAGLVAPDIDMLTVDPGAPGTVYVAPLESIGVYKTTNGDAH